MLSNENTIKLMNAKDVFRDNLKQQMQKKNVRSVDVCEALHLNKGTFSSWFTGRSLPSPTMLEQLCKYFDCTVEEMLNPQSKAENNQIISYIDQLDKLITYLKENLITVEEYNLLKAKLMDEVNQ